MSAAAVLADGNVVAPGQVLAWSIWDRSVALARVAFTTPFRVTLADADGHHWSVEATSCHPDLSANLARGGFRLALPAEVTRYEVSVTAIRARRFPAGEPAPAPAPWSPAEYARLAAAAEADVR